MSQNLPFEYPEQTNGYLNGVIHDTGKPPKEKEINELEKVMYQAPFGMHITSMLVIK
jgi:hypothetical protein